MNANAQTVPLMPARMPIVEKLLREAISDPKRKQAILDATGWDTSMPSKILSNTAGITLEHLDTLFRAIGLVVTTVGYMDYLAEGNVIGSNCRCARMNMGACGAAA
ncbi:DNA-binding protein [Paraburkholderia silviterrae]|uniref:DNA-binding protein n=1 Tax=Paraburkholderia silviterrae TaxID=2528715 RepID=A0A4R5M9E4_9BURK|nr:DNA-binding protein [Paraburkholderia silviterrae]TDG23247.1 DNA-binding protein [Paraburkholderia silviterrae]